jgi:hypothetical protein
MLVEKTNNLHFRADKINNARRKKQINLRAAPDTTNPIGKTMQPRLRNRGGTGFFINYRERWEGCFESDVFLNCSPTSICVSWLLGAPIGLVALDTFLAKNANSLFFMN